MKTCTAQQNPRLNHKMPGWTKLVRNMVDEILNSILNQKNMVKFIIYAMFLEMVKVLNLSTAFSIFRRFCCATRKEWKLSLKTWATKNMLYKEFNRCTVVCRTSEIEWIKHFWIDCKRINKRTIHKSNIKWKTKISNWFGLSAQREHLTLISLFN